MKFLSHGAVMDKIDSMDSAMCLNCKVGFVINFIEAIFHVTGLILWREIFQHCNPSIPVECFLLIELIQN